MGSIFEFAVPAGVIGRSELAIGGYRLADRSGATGLACGHNTGYADVGAGTRKWLGIAFKSKFFSPVCCSLGAKTGYAERYSVAYLRILERR